MQVENIIIVLGQNHYKNFSKLKKIKYQQPGAKHPADPELPAKTGTGSAGARRLPEEEQHCQY